MSDLFASAFIQILPDFSKFEVAVRAGLNRSMAESSAVMQKQSKRMADDYAAATKRIGKEAGKFALVTTAAAVTAGVAITRMASTFQSQMEMLHTQAGVAQSAIKGLSNGVLQLAGRVGSDPDSLAEALYHIESAFSSTGITSSKALALLETAAKGAQMGGANLVDVTNALTAAVAANIPGVQNLDQAMGSLNATVGAGDMKMQDLAKAFGTGAVAVVKGFGLSIRDVGAALATFGDNNIRGAQAGTALRIAVQALAKPTATSADELKRLGLNTSSLARDMQQGGLNKAITDLKTRLDAAGVSAKEQGQILTDIFGRKAGTGINIMIGQFDRLQSKYAELDKGAKRFGEDWAATQKTFKQQWDQFTASLKAFGIELGTAILPALTKLTTWLREKAVPALRTSVNVMSEHTDVVKTGAAVIGGVLVAAIGAWAAGMAVAAVETIAATWPILAVVAALAAAAAGAIYAWNHFKEFRDVVKQLGDAVMPMVRFAIDNVRTSIENVRNSGVRWDTSIKALAIELGALAVLIAGTVVVAIDAFTYEIRLATELARPFWEAWRRTIYGVIDLFGAMLIAGKLSMGWIPGIGGALDKATKAFFKFRDNVHKALDDIPKRVSVNVFASYDSSVKLGRNRAFADGGHVSGPGTGTSDSIPAWVSNGEYVVNARATAQHLPLLHAINAGHFAAGGLVTNFLLSYRDNATDAIARAMTNLVASPSAGGGNRANQALGKVMAAAFGWVGQQWSALLSLWNRESSWNNFARNPSSGAFGIPQALPPGKMGAAAVAGNPAAQIAWGLRYILGRYGSPMNAWAHEMRVGWYDQGGVLPPGLTLAMNGTGRNERVITGNQMLTRDDVRSAVTDALREVLAEAPLVEVSADVNRNKFLDVIDLRVNQGIRQAKRAKGV